MKRKCRSVKREKSKYRAVNVWLLTEKKGFEMREKKRAERVKWNEREMEEWSECEWNFGCACCMKWNKFCDLDRN